MDSRLLNVVYDDPFDGNYVKYDNDTQFWSSASDTMGMQLTETLNGILPISPTEDFHIEEHGNAIQLQNKTNAFNYENFSGQHLTTGRTIEIVSVDPNIDSYDTDSDDEESDDDEDDDDDGEDDNEHNLLDFERQSQCSNATFRTRTDSSSIGDYESHTSDYDDSDEDDSDQEETAINKNASLTNNSLSFTTTNADSSILDEHTNLVATDDLLFESAFHKNRTLSTNTVNSDVDGLGLQIDANNFDLAEFITKDDFQLHINATVSHPVQQVSTVNNVYKFGTIVEKPTAIVNDIKLENNNSNTDSDSDSDVIVDVETVEVDEDEACTLRKASEILKPSKAQLMQKEEETPFVDNIKTDPSWSPVSNAKKSDVIKIEEKPSIQKQNFPRNFPLVPNKKQCDLLKGKFTKGKGKSIQKSTKSIACKNSKITNSPVKQTTALNSTGKQEISGRKMGMGMGGKNLALLKHDRTSISEQSSEDNNTPQKIIESAKQVWPINAAQKKIEEETPVQAVKRKLNLDEYKKRREIASTNPPLTNDKGLAYKIPKVENKTNGSQPNNEKCPVINTAVYRRSEAVTSIVKSLKEQQSLNGRLVSDPITEAKNKVLRMQELKKAQQMRIIDSTISAKVPRVTKLLPLREIVKDTPYLNEENNKSSSENGKSTKSEYEEIIIMSASCNTDISIPPIPNPAIQPVNNASRSLLKSSALLSTISNTFQKVKASDNKKLSNSSLIASIQDVVVKKALPLEENIACADVKDAKKPEHHGEDKIIMHLRKDRIRKRMCSIGVQTDLQPEFPPLSLPKSSIQHKSRERMRKHRKRQYRKHKNVSSNSASDSSDEHSDYSNSSTLSSSLERMRTYDSAIGTASYSSRSSLRHRSSVSSSNSESANHVIRGRRQRRTSYNKRSAARKRSRSSYSSSSYTSDSDHSRSSHYRRSRSRSNSRTRSRSRRSSFRQNQNKSNNFVDRNVSQPAVEERRIVYVGRIEQETTKDILRRKFLQYGTIKQISIHFKDTGMKYGFVTFERPQDAFAAIDNSTRDPEINMYDVSFGGRRAFCRASYADLDNAGINTYHSYVFPQAVQQPKKEDSFEDLLMKMRAKLNANKTKPTMPATNGSNATATDVQSSPSSKI